jgi:hemerythrin-like domain-containing protein
MKATEILQQEHEVIKRMLKVLGAMADEARTGGRLEPADLQAVLEFIRTFADRCHHGKEEGCLFPAMEAAGVPREGGPIGVMLAEHELGRGFVRQMQAAADALAKGDAAATEALLSAAQGYISLLEQHIDKEDNVLYPIANMHLTPEQGQELLEEFERLEQEQIGPGRHEELHRLAEGLAARYLQPHARAAEMHRCCCHG